MNLGEWKLSQTETPLHRIVLDYSEKKKVASSCCCHFNKRKLNLQSDSPTYGFFDTDQELILDWTYNTLIPIMYL
mgnify:CR=1 FL=1